MRVDWTDEALDRLADIYVTALPDDKRAIAATAERINEQLAIDPWEPSESRGEMTRRIWLVHPLMVMFDVIQDDDLVLVTQVGRLTSKGQR